MSGVAPSVPVSFAASGSSVLVAESEPPPGSPRGAGRAVELPSTAGTSASSRRSSWSSLFSSWACATGSRNVSETSSSPSHVSKSTTSSPSRTFNRPPSWITPVSRICSPSGVANRSVTSVPGTLVSSSCISPPAMVPQPTSVLSPASVIINSVLSERPSAAASDPNRTPSESEMVLQTLFTATFHL